LLNGTTEIKEMDLSENTIALYFLAEYFNGKDE